MDQQENVTLFIDAIAHAAEERRTEIKREINGYIKNEVEKAEKEIARESESILAKKISAIKKEINKELSRGLAEKRMRIFNRREEIMDAVFKSAAEKIRVFKASEDYVTFLNRSIEEASKICGGMKIYIMEEDKKFINRETIIDETIKLGGLKFVSENILIDDTLDTRIESEKAWFKINCGLIIT